MTRHDFELTVNILIASNRKLAAIKFIRHCMNRSDSWLGLRECKDMVDNAAEKLRSIGVPFRIEHYVVIGKMELNRLKAAKPILMDKILSNKPLY